MGRRRVDRRWWLPGRARVPRGQAVPPAATARTASISRARSSPWMRKPTAPAFADAVMALEFSDPVSMSTRVAGWVVISSRVASVPEVMGIWMSISTRRPGTFAPRKVFRRRASRHI